jgi:hypothetical protein
MCRNCVAEGRMTQEELDKHNVNQTDGADFAAVREALDKDPAAFLALLMGEGESKPDPEAEDRERMDSMVNILLDFVSQQDSKQGVPQTAVELAEACERDAGRLMYKCTPAVVAVSLITITRRYAALLQQWAELYAKAAIGDDDTIDLDAATTSEAKDAVTRATGGIIPEHKTGMYL